MASETVLRIPLHPKELFAERFDIEAADTSEQQAMRDPSVWQREKRTVCWSITAIFLGIFVGMTGCFLLVPAVPKHAGAEPKAGMQSPNAVASAAFMPFRPPALPFRFGVPRSYKSRADISRVNAMLGLSLIRTSLPFLRSPIKVPSHPQIRDFVTGGDEEISVVIDVSRLREHIEGGKGVATDEGGHEAVDQASQAQEVEANVLEVEPLFAEATLDSPASEHLLSTFFEAWGKQDAHQMAGVLTEDASIHWKRVNPFGGNPWITWTRDKDQYCENDACDVLEQYHGKKQEVRAYDQFLKDMDKDFKEDIAKRSIECEGTVLKVTTKASVGGVSAHVLIHLTSHEGKIKDISIQPVCKHGVR